MHTLALLPLFLSTPAAELGGVIEPVRSPAPVVVNLYSGAERVASAQADLFGRYSLASPPGDYWLQILVGDQEQLYERVFLREGSWQRDFKLGVLADEAWVSVTPVRSSAEADRAAVPESNVL